MPLLPETLNVDYQSLPLSQPEEKAVILHYAAKIDKLLPMVPVPISESKEKKEFLTKLSDLAKQLDSKYPGKLNARVFKLKLLPPGRIDDIFNDVKRKPTVADYDVAFMCICDNEQVAEQVQQDQIATDIFNMFKNIERHDIAIAKNVRKAGDTHVHDKFKQDVYLFNYFYVEDTDFDFAPVWDHTGRWFVEYTGLNNSYLLKTISGDGHFQYINHCYWHRLSEFVPQLITKKSLHKHVLGNFTYNKAIAFPVIYEVVA